MIKRNNVFLVCGLCVCSLALGMYSVVNKTYPYTLIRDVKDFLISIETPWNSPPDSTFDSRFVAVSTSSTNDAINAYSFATTEIAPLVVSLHSWNGTWEEEDPIAGLVADVNWNYIHPDFQGENTHSDACLSEKVISDIDGAIHWAMENGNVDPDNIFVVGFSGGGYTALGYRLKTDIALKHTYAWAAITDLEDWYYQSSNRQLKYAEQVVACIGGQFSIADAQKRSPLYFAENANGQVALFAGLDDGYSGTVPITHSLEYFNKLAKPTDKLSEQLLLDLVSKSVGKPVGTLADRAVYLDRESEQVRLRVFDGSHEILNEAAFAQILSTYQSGR